VNLDQYNRNKKNTQKSIDQVTNRYDSSTRII